MQLKHACTDFLSGYFSTHDRSAKTKAAYESDLLQFQALKHLLETTWIELLRRQVGLDRERLPLLWDCDFLFGEPTREQPDRYVLCEINVSSVSPFPPSAIEPLVAAVKSRLAARQG